MRPISRLFACMALLFLSIHAQTLYAQTPCTASSPNQNVFIREVKSFSIPQSETYYSNPSGASSYTDYTTPCIPYDVNEYGIQLGVVTQAGTYLAIWIDYNDNGVFEAGSEAIFNYGPLSTGYVNNNLGIQTGNHLMRVIVSTQPITGPCGTIADGEVEDYTICFGCTPTSMTQNVYLTEVLSFSLVQSETYFSNPTGASAYTDYTGLGCIPYNYGEYGIQLGLRFNAPGVYYAIWIDLNDNGVFEAGEMIANSGPTPTSGVNIPLAAYSGNHRMRIVVSAQPITGPCDALADGETEDYLICFGCTPGSAFQNVFIREVYQSNGTVATYSNPSGASSYSDYSNPCIQYNSADPLNQIGVRFSTSGVYYAIYIDANQNGIFEPGEFINSGYSSGSGILFPLSGYSGVVGMRIIVSTSPINAPCGPLEDGEVEDYTICFPCDEGTQTQSVWIREVLSETSAGTLYSNPSGASAYSNFTDPCIPYDNSQAGMQLGIRFSTAGVFYAVYIDFNDNGIFEPGELLISGGPSSTDAINISLGSAAGDHLIRVIVSSTAITDPCHVEDGEIEDYTLCTPCFPKSKDQSIWISRVRVFDFGLGWIYDNPSGASSYSDYTGSPINLVSSSSQMNITPSVGGQYIAVFVDYNGNGIFETGEQLLNTLDGGSPGLAVSLSSLFSRGVKGCVRVRVILSSEPITGPCDDINSGEIEDYLICMPKVDGGGGGGLGKMATGPSITPTLGVYPSPTSTTTHVILQGEWGTQTEISVMDMHGRQYLRTACPNGELTLEVQAWPAGIYLIQATDGATQFTTKLVVE